MGKKQRQHATGSSTKEGFLPGIPLKTSKTPKNLELEKKADPLAKIKQTEANNNINRPNTTLDYLLSQKNTYPQRTETSLTLDDLPLPEQSFVQTKQDPTTLPAKHDMGVKDSSLKTTASIARLRKDNKKPQTKVVAINNPGDLLNELLPGDRLDSDTTTAKQNGNIATNPSFTGESLKNPLNSTNNMGVNLTETEKKFLDQELAKKQYNTSSYSISLNKEPYSDNTSIVADLFAIDNGMEYDGSSITEDSWPEDRTDTYTTLSEKSEDDVISENGKNIIPEDLDKFSLQQFLKYTEQSENIPESVASETEAKEARAKAAEEAARKAKEEARAKAEEAARKAEEAAARKAKEAARKAEEEARAKAEEEARKAEEAARKAEEEARKAEEEARAKAEEAARKAEEAAARKAKEAARKAEEEARAKAEEAARKAEEAARAKAEEAARAKAAEEARSKAESAAGKIQNIWRNWKKIDHTRKVSKITQGYDGIKTKIPPSESGTFQQPQILEKSKITQQNQDAKKDEIVDIEDLLRFNIDSITTFNSVLEESSSEHEIIEEQKVHINSKKSKNRKRQKPNNNIGDLITFVATKSTKTALNELAKAESAAANQPEINYEITPEGNIIIAKIDRLNVVDIDKKNETNCNVFLQELIKNNNDISKNRLFERIIVFLDKLPVDDGQQKAVINYLLLSGLTDRLLQNTVGSNNNYKKMMDFLDNILKICESCTFWQDPNYKNIILGLIISSYAKKNAVISREYCNNLATKLLAKGGDISFSLSTKDSWSILNYAIQYSVSLALHLLNNNAIANQNKQQPRWAVSAFLRVMSDNKQTRYPDVQKKKKLLQKLATEYINEDNTTVLQLSVLLSYALNKDNWYAVDLLVQKFNERGRMDYLLQYILEHEKELITVESKRKELVNIFTKLNIKDANNVNDNIKINTSNFFRSNPKQYKQILTIAENSENQGLQKYLSNMQEKNFLAPKPNPHVSPKKPGK